MEPVSTLLITLLILLILAVELGIGTTESALFALTDG